MEIRLARAPRDMCLGEWDSCKGDTREFSLGFSSLGRLKDTIKTRLV